VIVKNRWIEASYYTYHFRQEVDLVVSSDPDPRLVCGAALDEAAPCVPPVVVVERVRVGVREVTHEKHCLAFALLHVVVERPVRVERLPEIGCPVDNIAYNK
jgi:hypothetical protein